MIIWSFGLWSFFLWERIRFIEVIIVNIVILINLIIVQLIVVRRALMRLFLLMMTIRALFKNWMQFSKVLILSINSLEAKLLIKHRIYNRLLIISLIVNLFSFLCILLFHLCTSFLHYFELFFLLMVEFTQKFFDRVLLVLFIVSIDTHWMVIAWPSTYKRSLFLSFFNWSVLTLTYIHIRILKTVATQICHIK
jgi:hypothetical protein